MERIGDRAGPPLRPRRVKNDAEFHFSTCPAEVDFTVVSFAVSAEHACVLSSRPVPLDASPGASGAAELSTFNTTLSSGSHVTAEHGAISRCTFSNDGKLLARDNWKAVIAESGSQLFKVSVSTSQVGQPRSAERAFPVGTSSSAVGKLTVLELGQESADGGTLLAVGPLHAPGQAPDSIPTAIKIFHLGAEREWTPSTPRQKADGGAEFKEWSILQPPSAGWVPLGAAFAPDGSRIAVAYANTDAAADAGMLLHVFTVAWGDDETVSDDDDLDTKSMIFPGSSTLQTAGLKMVAWSPDGATVSTGAEDVLIFDITTRTPLHSLPMSGCAAGLGALEDSQDRSADRSLNLLQAVSFSADSQCIAVTGSTSPSVMVFGVWSGCCLLTVEMVSPIAGIFCPTSANRLFTLNAAGDIHCHSDLANLGASFSKMREQTIVPLAQGLDGSTICCSKSLTTARRAGGGSMELLSTVDGALKTTLLPGHSSSSSSSSSAAVFLSAPTHFAVEPGLVLVQSLQGSSTFVSLYDVDTGQVRRQFLDIGIGTRPDKPGTRASQLLRRASSRSTSSVASVAMAMRHDAVSMELEGRHPVTTALSYDGTTLAVAGKTTGETDGLDRILINIFSVETGERLRQMELDGTSCEVYALEFTPGAGKSLLAIGIGHDPNSLLPGTGSLQLLDSSSRFRVITQIGVGDETPDTDDPSGAVTHVKFSPSGKQILTVESETLESTMVSHFYVACYHSSKGFEVSRIELADRVELMEVHDQWTAVSCTMSISDGSKASLLFILDTKTMEINHLQECGGDLKSMAWVDNCCLKLWVGGEGASHGESIVSMSMLDLQQSGPTLFSVVSLLRLSCDKNTAPLTANAILDFVKKSIQSFPNLSLCNEHELEDDAKLGTLTLLQHVLDNPRLRSMESGMTKFICSCYPVSVLRTNSAGSTAFDTALALRDAEGCGILLDAALHESVPLSCLQSMPAILILLLHSPDTAAMVSPFLAKCGNRRTATQCVERAGIYETLVRGSARAHDPFLWQLTRVQYYPWGGVRSQDIEGAGEGEHMESSSGQLCTSKIFPIPGLASRNLLSACLTYQQKTKDLSVFENDAMAAALSVLWKAHIESLWLEQFGFYITFLVALILFAISVSSDGKRLGPEADMFVSLILVAQGARMTIFELTQFGGFLVKSMAQSRNEEEETEANTSAFCSFGSLWDAANLVTSLQRLALLFRAGSEYFDFWNTVDCTVAVLTLANSIAALIGYNTVSLKISLAIQITVSFVNLLSFFRGIPNLSYLVQMLIRIFDDAMEFTVIVLTLVIGFGTAFRVLLSSNEIEGFTSWPESVMSTYYMGVFGEVDRSSFEESVSPTLTLLMANAYQLIVVVVMMNALIAIMSDTFEQMQESMKASKQQGRAALVLEFLMMMPEEQLQAIEISTQWTHQLVPKSLDQASGELGGEWSGRMAVIRSIVVGSVSTLQTQLGAVLLRMTALEKAVSQKNRASVGFTEPAEGGELPGGTPSTPSVSPKHATLEQKINTVDRKLDRLLSSLAIHDV